MAITIRLTARQAKRFFVTGRLSHVPVATEPVSSTVTGNGPWVVTVEGWRPPLLNAHLTCHYMVRHREKMRHYEQIAAFMIGVPRATGKRHVSLHVTFPRRKGRLPDKDALHKVLFDGLVHCGVLVDDSDKWLSYDTPTYERGDGLATQITLEDL